MILELKNNPLISTHNLVILNLHGRFPSARSRKSSTLFGNPNGSRQKRKAFGWTNSPKRQVMCAIPSVYPKVLHT